MPSILIRVPEHRIITVMLNAFQGHIAYWSRNGREDYGGLDLDSITADIAVIRESINQDDPDNFMTSKAQSRYSVGDFYFLPYLPNTAILLDEYDEADNSVIATHRIDKDSIHRGIEKMAANSPGHFADLMQGDDDAVTADIMMQYICLGEVKYG